MEASMPEVARFLLDVPRMGACVPGIEDLRRVDEDRYEATLVVRLGPIGARFEGDVLIDAAGAPGTIRARATGTDGATGSVAQVGFDADLLETATGWTEVRTVSDVTIRGRLGQFGSGVISATAREMVKAFAQCASRSVSQVDGAEPTEGDQLAREPRTRPGIVSVIGRGLLAWVLSLRDRLFPRGGRPGGGE